MMLYQYLSLMELFYPKVLYYHNDKIDQEIVQDTLNIQRVVFRKKQFKEKDKLTSSVYQ